MSDRRCKQPDHCLNPAWCKTSSRCMRDSEPEIIRPKIIRPEPDCRTCVNFDFWPGRCRNAVFEKLRCTNADRYEPLPPALSWGATNRANQGNRNDTGLMTREGRHDAQDLGFHSSSSAGGDYWNCGNVRDRADHSGAVSVGDVLGRRAMTPAETSKALALAIGYLPEHVRIEDGYCSVQWRDTHGPFWCRFDFTEPDVIWPIAERYNCFPYRLRSGGWHANGCIQPYETAAEAVALAVIGGAR